MIEKIRNYRFYNSNLSDEKLKEIKPFIAKVEKFAKFALPKMGDEVKLYCEVGDVVGQGTVADLYIYGYNQMYDDQFEFERVNTKQSMVDQVKGIVRAFIGGQPTVTASAYWKSRLPIAGREKLIGPYVQVEYLLSDQEEQDDENVVSEKKDLIKTILAGKPVRKAIMEELDMFGMDDCFFIKEELVEFASDVEEKVNKNFKSTNSPFSIAYTGVWMEDDCRTVTMDFVCYPNETNYSASVKIDMRTIKSPNDLSKYIGKMADEVKSIIYKNEVAD